MSRHGCHVCTYFSHFNLRGHTLVQTSRKRGDTTVNEYQAALPRQWTRYYTLLLAVLFEGLATGSECERTREALDADKDPLCLWEHFQELSTTAVVFQSACEEPLRGQIILQGYIQVRELGYYILYT